MLPEKKDVNGEEDAKDDKLEEIPESMKHSNQQDNIVKEMEDVSMLNRQKTLYVEYGAGRAGLSSFVAAEIAKSATTKDEANEEQTGFLVVDRDTRRYKKDKDIKECGFVVDR